jgi:acetyl esterase/lipase
MRSAQVVLMTALVLAFAALPANGQAPSPKTYTYKKVGALEIKADVYGGEGTAPRPVVIWIHGGALIMGSRGQTFDRAVFNELLQAGYAIVSIDYRLAPETKLPEILEDLKAAYAWVRDEGSRLFHADPKRIAVMGGSAGGYLTLAAGYLVEPRPRALVTFWGYGDIAGDWYAKPDPFYSKQPAVSKDEAYRAVGGPPRTDSNNQNQRGRFYLYCRQNGLWPKEVSDLDPIKDAQALAAFCPVRNVSAKYPPTLMIHGTKDTDVPYEQSVQMAQELKRQGVPYEFITIPDGPHGWRGVPPDVVADADRRVVAFLKKHLAEPRP